MDQIKKQIENMGRVPQYSFFFVLDDVLSFFVTSKSSYTLKIGNIGYVKPASISLNFKDTDFSFKQISHE